MPEWLIILFVLAMVLGQLLVFVATGQLASRKGYRWIFWIFVGVGWLGFPILLTLPAANQPGLSSGVQQQRQKRGNAIGAGLTGLTYALAIWYHSHR